MTEIDFHQLTRTGRDHALPQLLARTLAPGPRAVVLCAVRGGVLCRTTSFGEAPILTGYRTAAQLMVMPVLQPVYGTQQAVFA